jgi:hypothetical protein
MSWGQYSFRVREDNFIGVLSRVPTLTLMLKLKVDASDEKSRLV